MFLKLGFNNEQSIHTLPLLSVPFHISPSLSLPLQTLRLVSLVSLITKTKRIAERSDTNCDTHTQSHTDRQSTLDKYLYNVLLQWLYNRKDFFCVVYCFAMTYRWYAYGWYREIIFAHSANPFVSLI
jgi:hypothetical protein